MRRGDRAGHDQHVCLATRAELERAAEARPIKARPGFQILLDDIDDSPRPVGRSVPDRLDLS
jgi:hypothetical protein